MDVETGRVHKAASSFFIYQVRGNTGGAMGKCIARAGPAWAEVPADSTPRHEGGAHFLFLGWLVGGQTGRGKLAAPDFSKKRPRRISAPGLFVVATSRGQRFGHFLHLGGSILRGIL